MSPWTDAVATRVFFRGLVFNRSWEDPQVDAGALLVRPGQDRVLAVASGGCNGLSLLCLRPAALTLIDVNPAQIHLVQLKLAAIRTLEHQDFYRLFGEGSGEGAEQLYRGALRAALPEESRAYWDAHQAVLRRGLGVAGKLGAFLILFRRYLDWRVGNSLVEEFFRTDSLELQRAFYWEQIEPRLWSGVTTRMFGSRIALSLAGMHPRQRALVDSAQGIPSYLRERIEYVLTNLPLRENYFAAQAALGRYWTPAASPPYLHENNFAVLRDMVDAVTVVTGSVQDFVRVAPAGFIDCFSLMDIFDWMTSEVRSSTLRGVLDAASDGGRLIYRSTVVDAGMPAELADRVLEQRELADALFAGDRSFTYASIHVYAKVPTSAGTQSDSGRALSPA